MFNYKVKNMAYISRKGFSLTNKNSVVFFMVMMMSIVLLPKDATAQSEEKSFTREQGFIIRPELYGAVLGEFGYQINPNFQLSAGAGVELGEGVAFPELVLGVRAYATETKWTAFFDYHIGLLLVGNYAIPDHRFTVGPSFKNFDFGGGIMYVNLEGIGTWGLCINLGYNFRIGKKN